MRQEELLVDRQGRDLGLLGYADADTIVYYHAPERRHTVSSEFRVDANRELPRVEVLYVATASGAGLASAAVQSGARGLVVAGTGAGSLGNLDSELAGIAAQGRVVVVRSARVGEGRVIRDDNWQHPGMVAADNLSPQKAALLLSRLADLGYRGDAGAPPPAAKDAPADKKAAVAAAKVDFSHQIVPILREHCGGCHNPDRKRGGLDVTSHAALLSGGSSGESIAPGDALAAKISRTLALTRDRPVGRASTPYYIHRETISKRPQEAF